ncbi:MAG: hypothetical protein H2172_02780 [Opitutus sp.]|nr:hypothetical protein [Opitutus sp.]MCS6277747.1 hypothetical protein [Opitutus sp.]MCS6299148.1 hypothetical protein [Opitutus sp.]
MPESLVKPGQLFVADWPFTDASNAKNRPALAISAEDSRGDVELLMVTSRQYHSDSVPINQGDYVDGPLPHDSSVRVGRSIRVNLDRLVPLAACVTPAFLASVRKRIILSDTRHYSALVHTGQRPGDDAAHAPWAPGQTIPYAGRVFRACPESIKT